MTKTTLREYKDWATNYDQALWLKKMEIGKPRRDVGKDVWKCKINGCFIITMVENDN